MALITISPLLAKDDTAEAVEDVSLGTGTVLENDLLLTSVSTISSGDTSLSVKFGDSQTIDGMFGALTIQSDGAYSYKAFDALREGQVETDTFRYTGVVLSLLPGLPLLGSRADLAVKVTGTNDLSTIKSVTPPAGVSEIAGDSSAQDIAPQAASLVVSDLDAGDPLTARVAGAASVMLEGVGAFTLPASADALAAASALSFKPATSNGGEVTIEASYDPAAADLDFLREGQALTITFSVVVNDEVADSDTAELKVTITGTNDAPTVADGQSFTVDENSAAGTPVGLVLATDPDGTPTNKDTLSYAITAGNDSGAFAIDSATGAITVADAAPLDFETTPAFTLTVKVSDGGTTSLSDSATVTVKLSDVDENKGVGVFELSTLETGGGVKGFVLRGVDANDQSGRSVAGAGDVNGDGFDDLIVGARVAEVSVDGAQSKQGESYVVYGKANGLSQVLELSTLETGGGAAGFVLRGVDAGDFSGSSVASAGDVNGDGFDDLIVGARYAEVGVDGAQSKQGESYVVYGKAGLPQVLELSTLETGGGVNGFVLRGPNADDKSGSSAASAGDVNGDGFDDLIVDARYAEVGVDGAKSNQGESYVVYGKAAGGMPQVLELSTLETGGGTAGFVLRGVDAMDFSGTSVASAGDVNGDGFDDLIVGARFAEVGVGGAKSVQGESYVVYGKAGGLPQVLELSSLETGGGVNGFVLRGVDAGDASGLSVASAGDVNGDGFDDLIVGAVQAEAGVDGAKSNQGEAYVVYGKAGGLPQVLELSSLETGGGTAGFVLRGGDAGDLSGFSVASAGDVNGDGFDDLIVGAIQAEVGVGGAKNEQGESYVVYGKAGGLPQVLELSTLETGGGANGFVLRGVDKYDRSGCSVASAGDVNGDGFDDLIVGAYVAGVDVAKAGQGESYVVYGGNFTGAVTFVGGPGKDALTGTAADESLVGAGGDDALDGKGGNDVLIGGEGNDVLIFDPADTLRVDGGTGTDTLVVLLNLDLDFTALPNRHLHTGIERIDLEVDAGNNTVTLALADVLNLSGSTNDLTIFGQSGDAVSLLGGFGKSQTGVSSGFAGDARVYDVYSVPGNDARVFVEQGISV